MPRSIVRRFLNILVVVVATQWNESSGEVGQNLLTLRGYTFENMNWKSLKVALLVIS